ncbi:hypothetical protein [Aureibacter tunicatorum]|uniref:Uncharacterized protein n=1 Tax=Aureibacter tunicatorum TaxID=866807 RepID=A0AAE4BR92_9BACT|nr:hypothetical protein [Aureibacter tunicatorum]MDR6238421.1 hypothetical protein [Aureibacter tunicatorum]BDD03453.1 hypothetical protein AUTU_09360 [Aureibacter tunicatorum]
MKTRILIILLFTGLVCGACNKDNEIGNATNNSSNESTQLQLALSSEDLQPVIDEGESGQASQFATGNPTWWANRSNVSIQLTYQLYNGSATVGSEQLLTVSGRYEGNDSDNHPLYLTFDPIFVNQAFDGFELKDAAIKLSSDNSNLAIIPQQGSNLANALPEGRALPYVYGRTNGVLANSIDGTIEVNKVNNIDLSFINAEDAELVDFGYIGFGIDASNINKIDRVFSVSMLEFDDGEWVDVAGSVTVVDDGSFSEVFTQEAPDLRYLVYLPTTFQYNDGVLAYGSADPRRINLNQITASANLPSTFTLQRVVKTDDNTVYYDITDSDASNNDLNVVITITDDMPLAFYGVTN